MKKSFFFAALMMTAAMFTACNSGMTPKDDTTKLWPACDANGENVGYIDNSGNMAVTAMYDRAYQYSCGYGCVQMGDNTYFLDKKGKTVQGTTDLSYGCDAYFYYNYCCFRVKSGMWGMMDKDLKAVIQPAYAWLGYMSSEGLVAARQDGADKYGYLNKKGEWAINAMYETAAMFEDGVAVVSQGDKYGAIDTKGQYQVNATYDRLQSIGESRIVFYDMKAGKGGMIDTKGNVIVPAMYDGCNGFADNGLCPVRQDKKWGYMDKNGTMKLTPTFVDAAPFYEGNAWVLRTEESNYELIGTDGNTVLTLGEDEEPVSVFHNGLCKVFMTTKKGYAYKYIDVKGNTIYSWSVNVESAPARVAGERQMNIAEMFAATPYGARFNRK
jgi:hypothetical protein